MSPQKPTLPEFPAWVKAMPDKEQAAYLAAEAYRHVGRVHPGIIAVLKADPDLRARIEKYRAEVMAEHAEAERLTQQ